MLYLIHILLMDQIHKLSTTGHLFRHYRWTGIFKHIPLYCLNLLVNYLAKYQFLPAMVWQFTISPNTNSSFYIGNVPIMIEDKRPLYHNKPLSKWGISKNQLNTITIFRFFYSYNNDVLSTHASIHYHR